MKVEFVACDYCKKLIKGEIVEIKYLDIEQVVADYQVGGNLESKEIGKEVPYLTAEVHKRCTIKMSNKIDADLAEAIAKGEK